MRKGFKSIGEIIGSTGGRGPGIARTIALANVASAWEEHMRDKFGCASSVSSINEGVIHIAVEEAVWAQQMSMLKKHILQELAAHCDISGVKDIRFSSFGSTQRPTSVKKPISGAKNWPSSAYLSKEGIATWSGKPGQLKEDMPEVPKSLSHKRGDEPTEASISGSKPACCEVCSIPIPKGSAFCPVCALRPHPAKTAEAVSFLLESPYATDGNIAEVCGLGDLEPEEAYEIIRLSRDAAGSRLIDEALCEARNEAGSESSINKARMLLVGSACASTGEPPDVIISHGLKTYFIPAILDAAGQGTKRPKISEK